jgi:hypothetical protein
MPDRTIEELRLERVRILSKLRHLEAEVVGLRTELGQVEFRINYFYGAPRQARSDWVNPVLTEKPRPDKVRRVVPDFGLELVD